MTRSSGLDLDCGIAADEPADEALAKLDNYLCELKEMQIRDGLHIFGESPEGGLRDALLVALARLPRGDGKDGDASLIRALAADLGFEGFDPLDCALGAPWTGPMPVALARDDPWRTNGDTVERLEALALNLVGGRKPDDTWTSARAVLDMIFNAASPPTLPPAARRRLPVHWQRSTAVSCARPVRCPDAGAAGGAADRA